MSFIRLYFIVLIALVCCNSCKNNKKRVVVVKSLPLEVDNSYGARPISELPEYVKEGVEGYGIIVSNIEGRIFGRPVKCRVVRVSGKEIKLRFLETTSLVHNVECAKKVKKGNSYWEKEGEFWLTYQEAIDFIRKHGWILR